MSRVASSPYDEIQLRNWRVAHFLAFLLALAIFFGLVGSLVSIETDLSPPDIIGVPWALGIFWIWGWMIRDLYMNGTPTNHVAWLLILVLVPVFGVLMYFIRIWRPRNRPFEG